MLNPPVSESDLAITFQHLQNQFSTLVDLMKEPPPPAEAIIMILRTALDESVRCQSAYAQILNAIDGDDLRPTFKDGDDWLCFLIDQQQQPVRDHGNPEQSREQRPDL